LNPFLKSCPTLGESGLGKTTFLNTLFNTNITENIPQKNILSLSQIEIHPKVYGNSCWLLLLFSRLTLLAELTEQGATLTLSIIDCPGYGDQLDRSAG
jgi:septin family protein